MEPIRRVQQKSARRGRAGVHHHQEQQHLRNVHLFRHNVCSTSVKLNPRFGTEEHPLSHHVVLGIALSNR